MHCVAGDGVGILAGAVIASVFHLTKITDIALEYALGFGFGWSIFQALFMRNMAGGSYRLALSRAFFPELLSMNCLMAAMVPVMILAKKAVPASHDPSGPEFWFVMSMALLVGFVTAYPMNWWLVARHLKHGMMTVRPPGESASGGKSEGTYDHHASTEHPGKVPPKSKPPMDDSVKSVSSGVLVWMAIISFLMFGLGLSIALIFGSL